VMVLFLFVIMLLNAGVEPPGGKSWPVRLLGIPLLVVLLGIVSFLIRGWIGDKGTVLFGSFTKGGPRDVGAALFTEYLLPFEVVSVLILVAILGAVVLGGKEID